MSVHEISLLKFSSCWGKAACEPSLIRLLQLAAGDSFYLALQDDKPAYGFRLQSTASVSSGKTRSPVGSSPGLQSPTKAQRSDSSQRALPKIFQGSCLVFWEQNHMRRAMELWVSTNICFVEYVNKIQKMLSFSSHEWKDVLQGVLCSKLEEMAK